MKKVLLLLLGGVFLMTAITGCSNTPNKKSKEEIENLFSDFTGMFPMLDLDFLYNKELTESIEEDEVGLWQISSYLYTADNDITSIGINLSFDIQKKECYGNLYITKTVEGHEVETEYPVSYTNKQVVLIGDSVNIRVKESLEEFKSLFELIELDEEYLNNLKSTYHFYNSEVPIYGVNYSVDSNDKNIKAIKAKYPNLILNSDDIKIMLEGNGMLWENNTSQTIRIFFDDNEINWFTARMSFIKTLKNNDSVN
ncbi:MAG: Csa1 family protein [Erysipelotrichaceae bacterium]